MKPFIESVKVTDIKIGDFCVFVSCEDDVEVYEVSSIKDEGLGYTRTHFTSYPHKQGVMRPSDTGSFQVLRFTKEFA